MVALARILGAGPLVGGSLRLLEQLADYVQCPQEEVPREAGPVKRAAHSKLHSRKGSRPRPRPRRRRRGSRVTVVTPSTSQKKE